MRNYRIPPEKVNIYNSMIKFQNYQNSPVDLVNIIAPHPNQQMVENLLHNLLQHSKKAYLNEFSQLVLNRFY